MNEMLASAKLPCFIFVATECNCEMLISMLWTVDCRMVMVVVIRVWIDPKCIIKIVERDAGFLVVGE